MKKIVFYNSFHKGDLHLSRTMVRRVVQAFPNIEFEYIHKHGSYILKDLPVKYSGWEVVNEKDTIGYVEKDGVMYLNTWYGSYDHTFQNAHGGITFDALYYIFEKHLEILGTSWSNIETNPKKLFPSIDWSFYSKSKVDNIVKTFGKYKKSILISNGDVLSGQSNLENFNLLINNLISKYIDVQFICTSKNGISLSSNVIFTDDIISINDCDLNEISYLSTFCDIIIGRSSGPYTFAMIDENMFNHNKVMISFSSISSGTYWLGAMANSIKYEADVYNYDNLKQDEVQFKIEEIIRR